MLKRTKSVVFSDEANPLQALYNAYIAPRETGNYQLRYPMTFSNDAMLRVSLTHTAVYISFIEKEAVFAFKAIVDPVNLVRKNDVVTASCGMDFVLQRLD